jgi:hypothetical protein
MRTSPLPERDGRATLSPRTFLARTDNLLAPAAICAAVLCLFVGARLAVHHGDPTRFVHAGREFVDARRAPSGLYVYPGKGFDGQFYYRLALDPSNLNRIAFGIRMDLGVRRARIAYPAIAWAVSAGDATAVPWALIALNLLALTALALLGAVAARDAGRHPLWGLLVPAFPGLLFALSRDLAEPLATAGLLAGLLLLRRNRPWLAGLALALGVLARESTLVAVAGIAVAALAGAVGSDGAGRRWRSAPAWVIPAAAFLAWESVVYSSVGSFPLFGDRGNLSAPFAGMGPEAWRWIRDPTRPHFASRLVLLALLVWVIGSAARSAVRKRPPLAELLAWLGVIALAICLSAFVYSAPGDFRFMSDAYALSVLILMGDRGSQLGITAAFVGVLWLGLAGYHVMVS